MRTLFRFWFHDSDQDSQLLGHVDRQVLHLTVGTRTVHNSLVGGITFIIFMVGTIELGVFLGLLYGGLCFVVTATIGSFARKMYLRVYSEN